MGVLGGDRVGRGGEREGSHQRGERCLGGDNADGEDA